MREMVYTYGLLAHKYSALSNALQQLKPQNPTRFQVLMGFCFKVVAIARNLS
jgi:hypothetical protein